MARRRRRDALPPEEKKRRDRESWARSRAKTGNWSSRAYNLAVQDAARWVRESYPEVWQEFYDARALEQRERAGPNAVVQACSHDVVEEVETTVHAVICTLCHSLLGNTTPGRPPAGYQVFTGDGGRVTYVRLEESA